jgi:hypothetical protein
MLLIYSSIEKSSGAPDRVWNQKDRGIPLQKEKAASPDIVAVSQEEKCGLKYVMLIFRRMVGEFDNND